MRGSVGPTESPEDPSQGPRGPRDPADGPGGSPGRPAGGPAGGPGSHPFDLLSHGIILVNEYGDVVWMNEVATERLTRDGSYHDGASHSQVFHAAGVQCLEGTQGVPACPVRACLRERHVVRSAKAKIFASSGSELVADLHLTPIPELASIVVGQDGPGVIVSFVETSPALAATRELRAYRQQAQAAERLAGMGSFWWDLETGEVTLSEAMKDLTVLGDEFEGTYEHGIEQILPDLRGGVEEMVAHAIQTGEPFEFEEHRGGDEAPVKHVRVRAEVAFGEDGRPSAIVGYVRDITQEYEAQQELELRQQRLEEAQRVARMGSWEYDVGQDEMRWSVGMYELFDQDPDTFVPSFQAHREIVLEEDRAIADAVRAKLDELGESYEYTVRYHKADGGVGWIRCRARTEPGASDGDLRIIGTVQDVTHEHAASVEVSRSEALLNEAQEVAHIGSWSWNIADDLITWSDELFRLYGLEPGGAAPDFETYLSMVHPEDRELAGGVVAKAMEDRQPFEFEHRLLRQDDGEERWLHGRGRVVLDDEDNLVRMVGTAHDITDRKRAELAVEEARGKLMEQEKLAALGTLVMGVAHEVRTPMTFVTNNLHVIDSLVDRALESMDRDERLLASAAGVADASQASAHVEPILDTQLRTRIRAVLEKVQGCSSSSLDGVRQIGTVLEEIRSAYRADLDQQEPDQHDLASVCEHALRLVEPTLPTSVRVTREMGALPPVEVVSGQIVQVLINLVTNASDAMEGAGQVLVRTRADDASVFVEVLDEGPGLAGVDVDELFEPFHTTKDHGTGLGLFLTKEIAERHGAAIEAFDRDDVRGAVFRLRLPCRPPASFEDPLRAPGGQSS